MCRPSANLVGGGARLECSPQLSFIRPLTLKDSGFEADHHSLSNTAPVTEDSLVSLHHQNATTHFFFLSSCIVFTT